MNKKLCLIIALTVICFSNSFGQGNIRSYEIGSKNNTPQYVEFSNDGRHIAAGVYGAVRVWNILSGDFIDYPAKYKNYTPGFVKFSPDSRFIVAGQFGEVRSWEIIK